jgi:hypothetical protein
MKKQKIQILNKVFSSVVAEPAEEVSFAGVSVMSIGSALGHGADIDAKSLATVLECVQGRKVKAFNNHSFWYSGNAPTEALGVFENFRIDGEKLRADFTFFKSTDEDVRDKFVEMARICPEEFGLSVSSECYAVWILDDGTEVDAWRLCDKPDNAVNDSPFMRFTKIMSIDFVNEPAANADGLFSAKISTQTQTQTKENLNMKKALAYLQKRFEGDTVRLSRIATKLVALSEEVDDESAKKIGDDIDAEVKEEETQAELAQLREQVEKLTKENEDLKKQLADADSKSVEEETEKKNEELSALGAKVVDLGKPAVAQPTDDADMVRYEQLCAKGDFVGLASLLKK